VSATPLMPAARGSRRILFIASLAAFMAFLDATIVNIAFPALQRAFPGEGSSSISWVLNAYNIVFAALLVPAGQLADRYSQRKLFLLGLALFTLASGCCAIAPTLVALIAFRMMQAVGAAIIIPTGMALLLPAFSPGEQIKAIALLAAVSGVAFAAGPSVGGALVNTVGWQAIFIVNVPIGVFTLLMASRFIEESRQPHDSSRFPDLIGALVMLVGVGLLALAIVQGNSWGWLNTPTVASFVAATFLICTAVWRARRHEAPAIQLDLFKARRFTAANIAIFTFAIGLAAKLLCDVLFMTSIWHYSELQTGTAVSASPLITAVLATSAARVAIRIGQRAGAALGGALYATGCLWYVERMGTEPHYLTAYLPGALLTGTGIALILPTLTSTAMLSVPSPRLAAGAGINSMIRQIGAVLGVALLVAIVGSPSPSDALAAFHRGWTLAAISSAVAAVATVTLLTSGEPRRLPLGALRNRAGAT
jgi:EmrB/QacA subfamily drug resistance transporter